MQNTSLESINKHEQRRERYLKASPYNNVADAPDFVACVGTNGNYGQDTICEGFCSAIRILLESLQNDREEVDCLVYPILFCVRHSIELYLKDAYNSIQYIYCARKHRDDFVKFQKLRRIRCRISQRIEIRNSQLNLLSLSNVLDKKKIQNNIGTLEKRKKRIDEWSNNLYDRCFKTAELGVHTHALKDLKKKILEIYTIDERIKEAFDSVLPHLVHYENIDPHGDAFRYQFDHNGESH